GGVVVGILASAAFAQPDPSGIDFISIGAAGNVGYNGPAGGWVQGRGQIDYEYRLGRTEVTTAQWMEFYNTFGGRGLGITIPLQWGAQFTGNPDRWYELRNVPNAADIPARGMSWRTCAMYCNWLCNGKSSDVSAVANGAYDISTFGYNGQNYTDQQTHNADAKYWIPTYDEWIKAAYYDPNKSGPGQAGWWTVTPNRSDTRLTYGVPGVGQANAGFFFSNDSQYLIPLGAYPQTVSPWGMIDAAGGTCEFLETSYTANGLTQRMTKGSYAGSDGLEARILDNLSGFGAADPSARENLYGLRVAAVVPSPNVAIVVVSGVFVSTFQRRRR
ncbi:MAG: SUMF1/EgtB/PvdO family nonheme iron enzyme, partial [Planctomycetota bacterium]|nr:SUMF1/EgtB/PvdO family nonheme iron enzyme [Planctomycetota bacterium]